MQLDGPITLVVNLTDSANLQPLTNRWHSMSGDLIVSNGTCYVMRNSKFAHVPRIEVAGGTLNLSAAWPNASEVVVSAGALNLKAEKLFGRRTTALKLSGGTLDLGGTEQRVYEIWVDGKMLPSGEYTAASEELKGYVTGAGTLRACGHGGSVMLVR